jgi:hypothetical protein
MPHEAMRKSEGEEGEESCLLLENEKISSSSLRAQLIFKKLTNPI